MIELDGYTVQLMQEAARSQTEYWEQMARPSMMLKPALTMDGNQFCALYGENLQEGIAGFGNTSELAYRDFDKNWHTFDISNSPFSSSKGEKSHE